VEEGYEHIDDLVILAEAGKEGLDEMVAACNEALRGGKLQKLKGRHILKIALAKLMDVGSDDEGEGAADTPGAVPAAVVPAAAPGGDANTAASVGTLPTVNVVESDSINRPAAAADGAANNADADDDADADADVDFGDLSFLLTAIERVSIRRRKSKASTRKDGAAAAAAAAPPPAVVSEGGELKVAAAETVSAPPATPAATTAPSPAKPKIAPIAADTSTAGDVGDGPEPLGSPTATGGASWVVHAPKQGKGKKSGAVQRMKSLEEMKAELLKSKTALDAKTKAGPQTQPSLKRGQTQHG